MVGSKHVRGGGYGDPKEREPEALLRYITDGRVSSTGAVRDYGSK